MPDTENADAEGLLSRLSDGHIRAGIGVAAALLFLLLLRLRFCGDVSLDAKPPSPPLTELTVETVSTALDSYQQLYAAALAEDAGNFHVGESTTIELMSRRLLHRGDEGSYHLDPGSPETSFKELAGLRLSVSVQGGLLVLRIDSLAEHPLAYHVETRPDLGRRCKAKETWRQNAMALRERGHSQDHVSRTECQHKKGKGLLIVKVETLELPELSYYYVSSVMPRSVGLTSGATEGHIVSPPATACQRSSAAALEASIEAGETTWHDLIDFYARHSCHAYRFPDGYKAFSRDGERRLPAAAE